MAATDIDAGKVISWGDKTAWITVNTLSAGAYYITPLGWIESVQATPKTRVANATIYEMTANSTNGTAGNTKGTIRCDAASTADLAYILCIGTP